MTYTGKLDESNLVEMMREGINKNSAPTELVKIMIDMPLSIRRTRIILNREYSGNPLVGVYSSLLDTAERVKKETPIEGKEHLSLPYGVTIERIIEQYTELNASPEEMNMRRDYLKALARLTYGLFD